ncbi:ABC transporter permease [Micrococcus endophyticus]|uniref:Peptide/nickel transport system permease protein n=1 Tax=Micrococcus endophyticus TaxID=455343 RepID=A0A7W9JHE1_9MICC|nr:ABC transporter permease [Micrococcus endophyticus]MBB5847759.1 peptide/nickel transport system permease protein [Micrococcus endophyticus]
MTTNNSSTSGTQLDEQQIFDLAEAEDAKLRAKAGKSYSQGALVRKRFLHHKAAMASVIVLVFITVMAFTSIGFAGIPGWWDKSYLAAATVVDGGRPTLSLVPQFLGGEGIRWGEHPFGQDSTGKDYFALVMRGTQQSMIIAAIVGLLSTVIGAVIGAVSGYFGGWIDSVLMRLTDLIIVIPLLVLAAVLGKMASGANMGILPLALVLGLVTWTSLARLVRGEVLSLREKEFVAAAVAMGARPGRVIGKHLLPNTIGVIVVNATFAIAGAVLLETSLSFLGFGVKAPDSSLGLLISLYQNSFTTRPWLFWWPGMIILAIALSVNFLGDGLRDAFDPRQGAAAGRKRGLFGRRAAKTDAGATTAGGLGTAPTARDGEADDLIADPDAPEHRRGGAGGPAGGVGQ